MTWLNCLQPSSEAEEEVAVSVLREAKDREEWEQHMAMAVSTWYQMYGYSTLLLLQLKLRCLVFGNSAKRIDVNLFMKTRRK